MFKQKNKLFTKIFYFNNLDSTNVFARKLYKTENDNCIIIAKRQTSGKGRNNRKWISDSNGLWVSFFLHANTKICDLNLFNIRVNVSLLQSVKHYIEKACIKWPNDILVNNKKLAGTLIETVIQGDLIKAFIFGIGINVKNTKAESLNEISTSFQENQINIGKIEFLKLLTSKLEKNLMQSDFQKIFTYWKNNNIILEKNITYNDGLDKAKVIDFDEFGNLIVRKNDNSIDKIHYGDIVISNSNEFDFANFLNYNFFTSSYNFLYHKLHSLNFFQKSINIPKLMSNNYN